MKNFKKIDDYFSDNLSSDMKSEFEESLEKDNDLKDDFDTYRASQNLIELMIQEDLLGKLPQLVSDEEDLQYASNASSDKQIDYEKVARPTESARIVPIDPHHIPTNSKSEGNTPFSFIRKLSVAASFLVIILTVSLIWYHSRSDGFSNVTNDNIVYVDISQMRGESNANELYYTLITLGANGEYKKANETIDQLIVLSPATYNYLLFFRAQNNFKMKNFDQADKEFAQVIDANMPKYIEDAQLMRVFTAIELKDIMGAKDRIEALERLPFYPYKEKLKNIKNEL